MAIEDVIAAEFKSYSTPMERAAYRAGLSTAAMICDVVKADTEKANTSRGRLTNVGGAMAYVAERCGDKIMAVRERVPVQE
mgnify:CR=1 FL=1